MALDQNLRLDMRGKQSLPGDRPHLFRSPREYNGHEFAHHLLGLPAASQTESGGD